MSSVLFQLTEEMHELASLYDAASVYRLAYQRGSMYEPHVLEDARIRLWQAITAIDRRKG